MKAVLIEIDCNKKTCGECEHRICHEDWAKFADVATCDLFHKDLKSVSRKSGDFYRLKQCLYAEEEN